MSAFYFSARFESRLFVVAHRGRNPDAEIVHGWQDVLAQFAERHFGDFRKRDDAGKFLAACDYSFTAEGESFHISGEIHGEPFVIIALKDNPLPFTAGDWFWERHDVETGDKTPGSILTWAGSMTLVEVVGAVQTRSSFGFLKPDHTEEGGETAYWFGNENDAAAALDRMLAEQDQPVAEPLEPEPVPAASPVVTPIVATPATMTPRQIFLARCALGFPTTTRRSYRNTYTAVADSDDADEWTDMVAAGFAIQTADSKRNATLALTRDGADRALKPGETLNPTDFPPIGAH